MKLFEEKRCSFEDFFDREGKFHCFSDEPINRRSSGRPSTKREGTIKKSIKVNEKCEDIKALFYGEEDKELFEDAARKGKESSEDAEVRELSKGFSKGLKLSWLLQKSRRNRRRRIKWQRQQSSREKLNDTAS